MIPWLSFFVLGSEAKHFGFNTNLLETNLVNILLLLALLVSTLGNFLKESLGVRQEQILSNLQDSEKKLKEAQQRLAEAKTQWQQAQILLERIRRQTKEGKSTAIGADFEQGQERLRQRIQTTWMTLEYQDQEASKQIKERVIRLARWDVESKLRQFLDEKEQHLILNARMERLGGPK